MLKIAAGFAFLCLSLLSLFASPGTDEKIRNSKVLVTEVVLAPNGIEKVAGGHPGVDVYWAPGSLQITRARGAAQRIRVTEGQSLFEPAGSISIKNTGQTDLHYTRVEFLGSGSSEEWRTTGLSPHYKLLIENRYARVYDIRIPAHTIEPQHTHRDRVVICLSGATLKHRYADGHEEKSTLATGQTAWRRGGTHVGQNLGSTDLWAIAIEPK
ncbi:MAG TPA: hypothetical protein VGR96_17640 [Acidobacteriaceae bacterium]|nr:hypothetical protein [Acidobacteriaceae bacterium]